MNAQNGLEPLSLQGREAVVLEKRIALVETCLPAPALLSAHGEHTPRRAWKREGLRTGPHWDTPSTPELSPGSRWESQGRGQLSMQDQSAT